MKDSKGLITLALGISALILFLFLAIYYLQNQSVAAELYATTDFNKEQVETNIATAALLNETTKEMIVNEESNDISAVLEEVAITDFSFKIQASNGLEVGNTPNSVGSTSVILASPSENPLEVTVTQGEGTNE